MSIRNRRLLSALIVLFLLVPRASFQAQVSPIPESRAQGVGARHSDVDSEPLANPRPNQPIDLIFSEPTSLSVIYRAAASAFGINVVFDSEIKDVKQGVELFDVTAADCMEILARTSPKTSAKAAFGANFGARIGRGPTGRRFRTVSADFSLNLRAVTCHNDIKTML